MQSIVQKTLEDTMYRRNTPVFIYKINYPNFSTDCRPAMAQIVNEYYTYIAKTTETYCRTVLFPQALESAGYTQDGRPFNSFRFDMAYQITYNAGCITSLFMETYTYMGGALNETKRTSDTWNFKTGTKLQFNSIYPLTPFSLYKLQRCINKQIANRLERAPGSYFDNYSALSQNAFNPNRFYLIPDSFVIYYQQYDIAPYASGIPEFSFPAGTLLSEC